MTNKLAVVVGRFGHLTKGHMRMINKAISESEKVLVLVGSAQESKTFRNPFSADTRKKVIRTAYGHLPNVYIGDVPDLTHENDITPAWGDFLLGHIDKWRNAFGIENKMDAMYHGDDEDRKRWFHENKVQNVRFVALPRDEYKISATKVRFFMATNDRSAWEEHTDPRVHGMYDALRAELLKTSEYKQIASSTDMTNIRILHQIKMPDGRLRASVVEKTLLDGVKWVYTKNDWCFSAGVVVLPFRMNENGKMQYLLRMECCPAHSDELELGAIMGGYDKAEKLSLAGHALAELHEEAGIIAEECHLIPLGTVRPEKSSDTTHYLYAIDVDQEGITFGEAIGDGTKIEEEASCVWVTEEDLAFCKMSVLSAMVLRLRQTDAFKQKYTV